MISLRFLTANDASTLDVGKETVGPETRRYLVDFLMTKGVNFLPSAGAMWWAIGFASIIDEPMGCHPRCNVQKRKREE